jgi:anti-anti-sigma regulatory factor
MNIDMKVEKAQGRVPVTILGLKGDLDASNFQEVINKGKDIYSIGGRDLLLDLSQLKFLSSSGIVAFHSLALIMRGDQPHDLNNFWNTWHAVREDQSSGKQEHVKLLNPAPKIKETLHKTGMDAFFEIFYDWNTALASFDRSPVPAE